jgi:ribonuclease-3
VLSLIRSLLNRREARKLLTKKNLSKIESLINHTVKQPDLFIRALTHRSAVDYKKLKKSNERLEFLGDAMLGFVCAEYLFHQFPYEQEGELTKMRANLVNRTSLYRVAKRIDLFPLLFINEDLLNCENFGYESILADSLEAFVGAIYLDAGFQKAESFIQNYVLIPNINRGIHLDDHNYKSQLLELTQAQKQQLPYYSVINEEGPEHDRTFTVQVQIGDKVYGIGIGKNKKAAEQNAAHFALDKIARSDNDTNA